MKKLFSALLALALCLTLGSSVFAAEDGTGNLLDVLCAPSCAVETKNGALLVADVYNKCVWLVKDGTTERYAGAESVADRAGEPMGGYSDAKLLESLFAEPWAVAPFRDGWAVSDTANNAVRLIAKNKVQTVNGGTSDRNIRTAKSGVVFERPTGLAADEKGNLYVANTDAGTIYRVSPEGKVICFYRELNEPTGLCWCKGALYVAETGAHRVVKIDGDRLTLVAGSGEQGFADGAAEQAEFSYPLGVAVDTDGTVYVADTVNSAVRRVKDGVVDTLLCPGDGALESFPASPRSLLLADGALLVCDPYARTLCRVEK